MARLRDSYGGTSGAEGDLGPCHLGCLLRCVLDRLAVLCAAAALLRCDTQPNVPRWTDACEMLASGLTPLANRKVPAPHATKAHPEPVGLLGGLY